MPEAVLGSVRALHVAACLSLFGALLFRAAVAPPALVGAPAADVGRFESLLARLAAGSLAVALATWLTWLWLQAAAMSGAEDLAAAAAAVPVALAETWFGRVSAVRLGLLAAVALSLRLAAGRPAVRRLWAGAGLSGASLVLIAGLGHAVAEEGPSRTALLVGMGVHVLAAGAWLGSLVPLAFGLAALPAPHAALAARRFSPLGLACVAVLAATAWSNGAVLVGSLPALTGTAYGRLALAKLVLLLAMLGCAVANRFVFTPALAGPHGSQAARKMRSSVVLETAAGLAVVFLAGMLAATPPAAHSRFESPPHSH